MKDNKKEPWKNETKIGLFISVIILGGMLIYIIIYWSSFKSLSPNEWGDFLAGSIGVLALIWLIVGYFLQSKELSQNTKALKEQKGELEKQTEKFENQTEAYNRLIAVTLRQAIANEKLAEIKVNQIEKNEKDKIEAAKPKFTRYQYKSSPGHELEFSIMNKGGTITNLILQTQHPSVRLDKQKIKDFESGNKFSLFLKIDQNFNWPIILALLYDDKYGNSFLEEYEIKEDVKELEATMERRLISVSE